VKLPNQQTVGISLMRFVLTLVISAALGTVVTLEQWNGSSNNAFRISSAFAQSSLVPVVSSVSVNGVISPITVPGGATVSVGVQNGPGNQWDCVSLNASPDVNAAWLSYAFLTPFSTTGTVTFTMPSAAGTYGVLFWQNCNTLIMTGPSVTVAGPTSGCSTDCFYVSPTGDDSNPGTPAQPWRTITKASTTLSAGQTAVVMDGIYEERALYFRRSGLSVAPITILAQNKGQAILSSLSGCTASINIYGSYVTIQDMRLSVSPNEPMPSGCSTANYVIHAWEGNEASPGNPSSGYVGFVLRGTAVDFSTHRNGGLKTLQDNSLIENNVFNDGIEASKTVNAVIRNNTLYSPGKDWIDLIVNKAGDRNLKVYGNTLHITNRTHTGILLGGTTGNQWLFDPPSGVECYDCEAYNNTVLNESGSSIGLWGFSGAKNSTIHDNIGNNGRTFLRPGGTPGSEGSANPGSTFTNNTIDGLLGP
jgi:hypothetical protein